MSDAPDFADLAWLFTSNNQNRGILRQNFDEAALLWRAVRASRGAILEIGRRHGGSTVLLIAAGAGRPVTSVDLAPAHNPACDAVFQRTASEQPQRLELLVGNSRKAMEGRSWGFMFIDGDHTYEGVKADVRAHWNELQRHDDTPAAVVFHDAVPNDGLSYANQLNHHEGVRLVCEELISTSCAKKIDSAGSSLWLEKIADLPEQF
jgi:predicted O-methyltransferase YrrM